jgi:3-dehydroquinate synthase
MKKIQLSLEKHQYSVLIHNNFSELKKEVHSFFNGRKIAIITDDNVSNLYLSEVVKELQDDSFKLFNFIINHGEKSKSNSTLSKIYDFLMEIHFERSDLIVALGGGVVGDIAGYAAATYLRGVALIQIPTTLLAQVDSSIGGKTAINYRGIKNLIGAFHQPSLVYINIQTVKTLPEREFRNGLAEVIVHGIIQDESLIEFTVDHFCNYLDANDDLLEELIFRNCQIKANIVMRDEKDKDIRKILNFGHTIGHAIESIFDYRYAHGECVSIGIISACKVSLFYKLIDYEKFIYINSILSSLKLPIEIKHMNWDKIVQKIKHDKKMNSGEISFIVPTNTGGVLDYKLEVDTIAQILKISYCRGDNP